MKQKRNLLQIDIFRCFRAQDVPSFVTNIVNCNKDKTQGFHDDAFPKYMVTPTPDQRKRLDTLKLKPAESRRWRNELEHEIDAHIPDILWCVNCSIGEQHLFPVLRRRVINFKHAQSSGRVGIAIREGVKTGAQNHILVNTSFNGVVQYVLGDAIARNKASAKSTGKETVWHACGSKRKVFPLPDDVQ